MRNLRHNFIVAIIILLISDALADSPPGRGLIVRSNEQLAAAIRQPRPGTTIFVAPGRYRGGLGSSRLRGTAAAPITIAALDSSRKPVLLGGGDSLKLVDPAHVILRDIVIEGASGIGLHLDDGGTYETPGHDVQIIGVEVRDSGDQGIKMTGIDRLRMSGVLVQNWAGGGGCGINLIGCHDVVIEGSSLVNLEDQGFGGIQLKGGCSDVTVSGSRFVHCGTRAIQVGGATSVEAFRPSDQVFEACRVTIQNNVIVGSEASLSFVNSGEVHVVANTFYLPRNWVFRILQENNRSRMLPTQNADVTDNIIVFDPIGPFESVNVGRNTDPSTFRFARNWWYRRDRPQDSRPLLPSAEREGVYGVDPEFTAAESLDLRPKASSPARARGAYSSVSTRAGNRQSDESSKSQPSH